LIFTYLCDSIQVDKSFAFISQKQKPTTRPRGVPRRTKWWKGAGEQNGGKEQENKNNARTWRGPEQEQERGPGEEQERGPCVGAK
jgi:hypothetical protein